MGFLGSIWTKIIAIGAIILGILITVGRILAGAKKAGQDEVRAKASEAVVNNVLEAKDAQGNVANAGPDAVDEWLRAPSDRGKR